MLIGVAFLNAALHSVSFQGLLDDFRSVAGDSQRHEEACPARGKPNRKMGENEPQADPTVTRSNGQLNFGRTIWFCFAVELLSVFIVCA